MTTFRGPIVNHGLVFSPSLPGLEGTLTLTLRDSPVPLTGATQIMGLGGEGPVIWGATWGDSLLFVTASETADTIAWVGRGTGDGLAGVYRIVGGPYLDQGGRWSAARVDGPALTWGPAAPRPVGSIDIQQEFGGMSAFVAALTRQRRHERPH